ncbi:invasion associated locus B family protein [Bosea caraganae]|uniref:Invasion associated locus B family protein n=1 Tax=Bosea caraganae TaxID=2763117 RepID=A0A370L595_9HYPH|nr:invasion associated locus B family protein [Bosea caraganae]RDJ24226.1 invasion associated locus B family protein [Bosea caraganae]RDJ30267.1 invasion associated locus B family protein [Bosea caraganae]
MSASSSPSRRALGLVLSAALGLSPVSAFAQQPRPAQPRPAQPAPQQPAQPPAGQGQAAGPTVVQVKAEPSQTNWTKVCGKDQAANKEICYTTRDFVSDQGQPVLAVAIYDVKGDPTKIVRFLMPLGLLLGPGIRFGVDTAQPVAGRYAICFPNGCFAEAQVKDDFINAMKKGTTLSASVQNQGGREVSFQIPLTDFAKGFDGAPIDPKVLEEQQKQLQDELAKRQEELRQRLGGSGASAVPGAPAAPGVAPAPGLAPAPGVAPAPRP